MKKITSVLLLSSLWLTMSVLSTAATDIPVEIPCPVAVAPSSEYQYDPTLNAAGDVVWLEYDPVTGYDQVFSNWAGQLTFDEWNHESASLNSRRDVIWEWFDEAANFWRISGIIEDLPGTVRFCLLLTMLVRSLSSMKQAKSNFCRAAR
jgi:hypothetical protein